MNRLRNYFCRSRSLLFSISFICIIFSWSGLANDLPMRLEAFLEKHKDPKFDPSDPTFSKIRIAYRKSIRFEIESFDNYSAVYRAINLKDFDISHATIPRSVLHEFQLPNMPLPKKYGYTKLATKVRARSFKSIPKEKRTFHIKFILDYDMCFYCPIFELSKEFKERHFDFTVQERGERLNYLLLFNRYFQSEWSDYQFAELALLRACWVPDKRALRILKEAQTRLETDIVFYEEDSSLRERIRKRIKRIDEMIELNAIIIKSGLAGALSEFRFANNMRSSFTNADAVSQFFSEFKTKHKEAKKIAITAIKALVLKHLANPKNLAFKEQATDIAKGFRACLDRKTDIGKEATGISSYEHGWFPGKAK